MEAARVQSYDLFPRIEALRSWCNLVPSALSVLRNTARDFSRYLLQKRVLLRTLAREQHFIRLLDRDIKEVLSKIRNASIKATRNATILLQLYN